MSEPKLILGIGIDENLQWATAEATEEGIQSGTIKSHSRPLDDTRGLEVQLNELIQHLKDDRPTIFRDVSAIGVNTSGIVDTNRHTLSNITRKALWRSDLSYIINFKDFLSPHVNMKSFKFERDLLVQNDASGSALAEFGWGIETGHVPKDTRRFLYVRIDEGVNIGVINLGQPMEGERPEAKGPSTSGELLPATRHPEAGHIRPRRHELDTELLSEHSGCSSHPDCFEALASMARIRKQFGPADAPKDFSLRNLPLEHKMWIIEANYIAQICYLCVLIMSPQVIIVGGGVGLTDSFLEKIRDDFAALNRGHFTYPEMGVLPKFIKRGLFGPDVTVLGALQLAERASRGQKGKDTNLASVHYLKDAKQHYEQKS